MTDRPILFSAPMVRALLAGTKFQTRRVLSPQPEHLQVYDWKGKRLHDSEYRHWCWKGHVGADNWDDITAQLRPFLPYAAGDRLYVREAWKTHAAYDDISPAAMGGDEPILYDADGAHQTWGYPAISKIGRFRQGMHMPRWASRLTLTVTEVRVQRLQEISEADATAEGIVRVGGYVDCDGDPRLDGQPYTCDAYHHDASTVLTEDDLRSCAGSARWAYRSLWDKLNADRGYGWKTNPWVCAVSFNVIKQNIDQVKP
ncbi:MAG: hypothetical protein EOS58_30575 [Mesorhizobium sp.]|nr:MAG: hypothetical protein EOS58_30575 [Mesorhizobium sp.]